MRARARGSVSCSGWAQRMRARARARANGTTCVPWCTSGGVRGRAAVATKWHSSCMVLLVACVRARTRAAIQRAVLPRHNICLHVEALSTIAIKVKCLVLHKCALGHGAEFCVGHRRCGGGGHLWQSNLLGTVRVWDVGKRRLRPYHRVEHLCAALTSTVTTLKSLKISDCHLGPKSIAIVAVAQAQCMEPVPHAIVA